jgi:hypothetical protein
MSIDFGSGLKREQDHALTGPLEADPAAMETMNFWAYDAAQNIGINIHPVLKNSQMLAMVTLFLPDGSIRRQRGEGGAFSDALSPGTEHIAYKCVEPFRRWTYTIDALPAFATSDAAQRLGTVEDESPTTSITLSLTSEGAAPIWRNGSMTKDAAKMLTGPAGLWIAGRLTSGMHPDSFRYDQLVRVRGTVGGTAFNGVGLRCHVRGVRILEGMGGTCWMSGLFPSGKGFGVNVSIGADGRYLYSEAYTTDGKTLSPARILQFPRRHRDLEEGRFWLQFTSDAHGLIDIAGEDVRAFYWSMPSWGSTATTPPKYGKEPKAGVLMKQALARYEWDGEIGYGLNERSG